MDKKDSIKKIYDIYGEKSKHSNYQSMPDFVEKELSIQVDIDHNWRSDKIRYDFIKSHINLDNKTILDIGANTGFFSLSLAHDYSTKVYAYEANNKQCELITEIKTIFSLDNLEILNQSLSLNTIELLPKSDICLLLNVLHHAGCEFDQELVKSRDDFSSYVKNFLTLLKSKTDTLVFQFGYNWGGNKENPIIDNNDYESMLDFLLEIFAQSGWFINIIGIAQKENERFNYLAFNPYVHKKEIINLMNSQSYKGEFYKRPLIISEKIQ
jgi:hypothetical protein